MLLPVYGILHSTKNFWLPPLLDVFVRVLSVAAHEKAEADKIAVVKAAEADAEAKFLAGQGIARQRQAIINGLRESVKDFSTEVQDITSKEVMQMMMMTQYFDMLKDVGSSSRATSVFVPHGPGSVNDVGSEIRRGFMEAQSMTR
eukprot:TRINITY_DN21222_c0_g2_i1.p1 TRINITY_DN21222_c0_g2~~TRINITY_DN21222_c0_g2_i1.p1  ORF type:complete len:145 (+),score=24.67 TRINITY_DN21222_c0_g2_i1:109-543(+)